MRKKYRLASGTQVREEGFGLLFYTMKGPRLYFLSCGKLLESRFFQGQLSLDQWISQLPKYSAVSEEVLEDLGEQLNLLKERGVLIECRDGEERA